LRGNSTRSARCSKAARRRQLLVQQGPLPPHQGGADQQGGRGSVLPEPAAARDEPEGDFHQELASWPLSPWRRAPGTRPPPPRRTRSPRPRRISPKSSRRSTRRTRPGRSLPWSFRDLGPVPGAAAEAPSAPAPERETEIDPSGRKSGTGNWLVDAMDKKSDKSKKASERDGGERLRGETDLLRGDERLNLPGEKETQGLDEAGGSAAEGKEVTGPVYNPLDRFMSGWISAKDRDLLLSGAKGEGAAAGDSGRVPRRFPSRPGRGAVGRRPGWPGRGAFPGRAQDRAEPLPLRARHHPVPGDEGIHGRGPLRAHGAPPAGFCARTRDPPGLTRDRSTP
jgi:hypothetical protein